MFQAKAKILYNRRIQGNYFHLAFASAQIARNAQPGQFLNIRINSGLRPLLRRPFGIHNINKSRIEILYEVVGPGTELLARKKPGEILDALGPLGKGFRCPVLGSRCSILAAGGIGVAPLLFLAKKLTTPRSSPTTVLIGAETRSRILCEKDFKKLGCNVKIATDDGSRGFKGYVSGLLAHLLRTMHYELRTIYACGPEPMLREVSKIAAVHNIPAQVSLDEHMACGLGACFGCAVETKAGYKRACKDGPVFPADEIIW